MAGLTDTNETQNIQPSTTGPIGMTTRAILGVLFLALTIRVFIVSNKQNLLISLILSFSVFILITFIYFVLHKLIESKKIQLNSFVAASLANGIVGAFMGLGYFLQNLELFVGSTSYVGITLLITSYKRYTGCEVMSLPAVLTKKHTPMPCIVFTPIDKWENAHSSD